MFHVSRIPYHVSPIAYHISRVSAREVSHLTGGSDSRDSALLLHNDITASCTFDSRSIATLEQLSCEDGGHTGQRMFEGKRCWTMMLNVKIE